MKKGKLITFEGGEGCGKSTQIKMFAQYLNDKKIDYIISREPGGTEIGEKIREILLHCKSNISPTVEFLLFSASRAEHLDKVVRPALNDGKVVLLDRYYDSSFVYQGYAGGLKLDDIAQVTKFAIDEAEPDLTFILDINYEEGLKRKAKDQNLQNLDRIELKGKQFHCKVREGYLKLAKVFKNRIVVIDAEQPVDKVFKDIIKQFELRIKF